MSDPPDEPAEDETAADPGEPVAPRAADPALAVLDRYLEARRRADDEAAARAWDELIVMSYDVMRNKVAGLVYRRALGWLTPEDIDDVVQDGYERAQGMALTFNGQALGQARAALVTTAHHAALDANRRQEARQRDVEGSIDEQRTHPDGSTSNRWEGEAAGEEDWTERSALASLEHAEVIAAIGRLPSEDQRQILLLTREGYTSREIAQSIGKAENNVDKLRERGMRALREDLGHE